MGRTDRSKEGTRRNPNEGTSARTRPTSFGEIMSKRKKQQNSNTIEKDSKMKEYSGNVNDTQDHTSSDDCHQIRRISKDSVKERSKKEESTSRRELDRIERRYIGACDLEMGVKVKSIRDKSSRDKESNNEKYRHHAKTANLPAAESEKANGRKRLKDYEEKDKYVEQDRKSKRDWKRKSGVHYEHKSISETDASKFKKHDSVKPRDTKYSERDGSKNYHLEPFYEEPRLKKRRSRSREYDHERGRSPSLSPLSHKRVYYGRDQGDFYKDNSRKKQLDGDRYRTSSHVGYSGGHYWKHGSGLGGYSPRKRKTEAAVKSPSPTSHSPERKIATWDQLPSGTSNISAGSILTAFPLTSTKVSEAASSITVTPATTKAHPSASIDSVSVVMNASVESVQLTQATRPLRRLYIENLPPSASEKSVIDCLNDYLLSSGASPIQRTKSCISCIINKDKCQALVEFLTPEDATAALLFDGNNFSGTVLKMRRPKDFTEAASGVPEQNGDVVKTVSDVVNDSPYKIFVGGISDSLSSKMLMEIASAFGPLKAYRFNFNKEHNGSCVFLEYEDHSITSRVCAGLNGLMLGGCMLTAVRAFPYANGKVDDSSSPSYDVPPHARPLLANVTPVLRLQNVVNLEDLSFLSENELEETLEDVRLECARFGTVKSVHLVRHSSSSIEFKSEVSEQPDPANVSKVIESTVEFHSESLEKVTEQCLEEIRDVSTPDNVKELQNVKVNDAEIIEDDMKEAAGLSENLQGIDHGENVQTEEHIKESNVLFSKLPVRIEMHDVPLAGDTDLDPIEADKEGGQPNGDLIFAEEADLRGPEEQQAHVSDAFEPGSVLVEFQRKEAACSAAHCLHGRCYGERTVAVEYIPHDFYLKSFPK